MSDVGLRRLASQIRLIANDMIQNKLADPRLERMASITRVEVAPDLSYTDIHISVMGTEGQQRAYIKALQQAHGLVQRAIAKRIRTRTCPVPRFHLDLSLKRGAETMQAIDKAMAELAEREESGVASSGAPAGGTAEHTSTDKPEV